jgi:hypothetical protein
MYTGDRRAMNIEVPSWAVDHHTQRGRSLGRTEAAAYDESYRLENRADDVADRFEDEARAIDGTLPRS